MGSSREKRGPIRSTRWRQVLRRAVTVPSPPWVYTWCPPRTPLSLPWLVAILGLVSPCALSRFVADRGNHSGLASGSTMWYLSPAHFLPPTASSSADVLLLLLNPPVSIVFSIPPHSFIPMFVLLFALPRFNYVCVYLCRLTLVPTTIPDSLAVTQT